MNTSIPPGLKTFITKEEAAFSAIPLRTKILGAIILISLFLNFIFLHQAFRSSKKADEAEKAYKAQILTLDEKIAEDQQAQASLLQVIEQIHQDQAAHERKDSLLATQQQNLSQHHQQTKKEYEVIKDRYRHASTDSLLRALDQ